MLRKILLFVEQNYSVDILSPIEQEAKRRGIDILWFFSHSGINPTGISNDHKTHDIQKAVDFRPDAVFVPGNRVPSFISGLKVQVFHGLSQDKRGNIYPDRGMFDLYCTEGPTRTKMLEKYLNRGYFKIAQTGWVKFDKILNHKCSRKNTSRPAILFASTFTPELSCAELMYNKLKESYRNNRYEWLFTLHPKMAQDTTIKYKILAGDHFYDNSRVIELLHQADILISDNSSIIQEFLLLQKPVITINNINPKSIFININKPCELDDAIEQALRLSHSEKFKIAAQQYIADISPISDGKAASRIIDAVEEQITTGWVDRKPHNIIRNLKMRYHLGYWAIAKKKSDTSCA